MQAKNTRSTSSVLSIDTRSINREKWLELRRKGIGGSDVSAILGLNPYASPYSVWADKLGLLPEKDDTEAMRQGRDLEGYVAQRFCEKSGKKVRRINKMLRDSERPFMVSNIDRDVVGESSGLECKTTSAMNLKKFKSGEFPEQFYCQCAHYLCVTGYERWYLAVLVLNAGFFIYQMTTIENDVIPEWCDGGVYVEPAEFDALIRAETDFWNLVETQTPPPMDGMRSTTEALDITAVDLSSEAIDLFDSRLDFLRLETINSQMRVLAKDAEQIRQRLKFQMGGTGKGYCEEYEIIWSNHQRAFVDKVSLLKYCPKSVVSKIIKVKPYKSFRIRKCG